MTYKHWDDFWSQGFITTFGETLSENYTGELRVFWENLFSSVKDEQIILDLATGNGAIACIAADVTSRHGKLVSILASDVAKISDDIKSRQETKILRSSIKFFSKTPCEKLPFAQNQINLATSQFGIEYSDWNQSLREIFRILKPGASAHFICHHESSSIVKSSMSEIEIYDSALKKHDIFSAATEFVQNFDSSDREKSARSSQHLNKVVNEFRLEFQEQPLCSAIIAEIAESMKRLRSIGAKATLDHLTRATIEFESARARLKDMKSAALGAKDIENVLKISESEGFSFATQKEFRHLSEVIGVHLHLTK